jgi:hypothetical protein
VVELDRPKHPGSAPAMCGGVTIVQPSVTTSATEERFDALNVDYTVVDAGNRNVGV